MRTLSALLLLSSLPAFGAIAIVSHVTLASGTTSSAIDTSGATLLVLSLTAFGGAPTVADSKSNTWTALTDHADGSNHVRMYYVANPTVGTGHTFTVTTAAGYYVAAFSGVATSNPLDQESGANTPSGVTTLSTGSVNTSTNGQLLVTGLLTTNGGSSQTIDNGFTIADKNNFNTGVTYGGGLAYFIQTSAGALNPAWSWTTAVSCATGIATFKAAVTASGIKYTAIVE